MPNAPASKGRAAGDRQGAQALVIGCGFIGSHVVKKLAAQGQPPAVLTRSRPLSEIVAAIRVDRLHLGDAADPADLEPALEDIDHVVYCAGGLLPAASEKDPERDAELTLAPLRMVLAMLRSRPHTQFVYISSGGTVYGEPEYVPVPETAPTSPLGSYGRLHLSCEEEIGRHCSQYDLRARILRCSTVYGEYQWPDRGQGVVPTFLHRIERGEPVDLYGGGATIRDYVYAGDVASVAIELLGREDGPRILNVASGEGTSLIDLLRLVEGQVGRKAVIQQHAERGFDVHRIVLDISRLRDLTGFRPIMLQTGIERTHAWLSGVASERV